MVTIIGIILLASISLLGIYSLIIEGIRHSLNKKTLDRVERLLKRGELNLAEEILRSTLH